MPLYAGKYVICAFLQNMRNMLRSHDRYKPVSLTYLLTYFVIGCVWQTCAGRWHVLVTVRVTVILTEMSVAGVGLHRVMMSVMMPLCWRVISSVQGNETQTSSSTFE